MSDLSTFIDNTTGRIILQRPEALNALTYDMCKDLERILLDWQEDPHITQVMIEGEGARAFCAGGDVAKLYHTGKDGEFDYSRKFWIDEYRLNQLIADYAKPFIAFMHGYVMGGGVGISAHGSLRIVDETTQMAMPECAIGLIPDVGGSYLLASAPGRIGNFLGVTGFRMNGADSIYAGFADIYVSHDKWDSFKAKLIDDGLPVAGDKFAEIPKQPCTLKDWRNDIDEIFADDQLKNIDTNITIPELATHIHKAISYNSPLSMRSITEALRLLRRSTEISVRAALDLEYRFSYRCMSDGDFLEGVRAMLVDKDKQPKWQHKTLSAVTDEQVNAMLAAI